MHSQNRLGMPRLLRKRRTTPRPRCASTGNLWWTQTIPTWFDIVTHSIQIPSIIRSKVVRSFDSDSCDLQIKNWMWCKLKSSWNSISESIAAIHSPPCLGDTLWLWPSCWHFNDSKSFASNDDMPSVKSSALQEHIDLHDRDNRHHVTTMFVRRRPLKWLFFIRAPNRMQCHGILAIKKSLFYQNQRNVRTFQQILIIQACVFQRCLNSPMPHEFLVNPLNDRAFFALIQQ